MEQSFSLTLQIIITVAAGISAQVLAQLWKIPSIVLLLCLGVGLGKDGLGIVRPEQFGVGLEVLVSLIVAVILFEGGLNLDLGELRSVSGSLRNLVTIGTLITLLGGTLSAHWLGEFPWGLAAVYGSLVVVTGPTVINSLLQQVKVDRQVSTILEGEGVLIDPIGAIVAVVVFNLMTNSHPEPLGAIVGLGLRLGIGAAIGGLGGWLLSWFLKIGKFLSADLNSLVVLATLWLMFALSGMIISEAGLMATVIAGIVLGASAIPQERSLKRFKGQLTVLGISVLFILLSADLSLASLGVLGWGSVATVIILMVVVRPINIWVCTWNSDLDWRQKAFLSWIAPRGIVSASVASLFAILLEDRGINGGEALKAIVFLTIGLTVVIQGLSAGIVARWLGLGDRESRGLIIVGAHSLGRIYARLAQQLGEQVLIIDSDAKACEIAKNEGLAVHYGSGFDLLSSTANYHNFLTTAGISECASFMALTESGEVNLTLAQTAWQDFRVPQVLGILPPTNNYASKIDFLPLSFERLTNWNKYLENGQVKLGETTISSTNSSNQIDHLRSLITNGQLLPLFIHRSQQLLVVNNDLDWEIGDRLIYLLYDLRPDLLRRLSGNQPEFDLVLQTIPQVEWIVDN